MKNMKTHAFCLIFQTEEPEEHFKNLSVNFDGKSGIAVPVCINNLEDKITSRVFIHNKMSKYFLKLWNHANNKKPFEYFLNDNKKDKESS